MTPSTEAATLLSAARRETGLRRDALYALAGTAVIAASAQVAVPMVPVPMTMQSLVILIVGMAYGWRLGGATVALYLAEGLIGLPVFANFHAGPAALFGPTGGYLFGFVGAAALAGWLAERGWSRGVVKTGLAMLIGHAVLFATGISWLANFTGWEKAVALGFVPFILGSIVKIALGAALMPALWGVVAKRN